MIVSQLGDPPPSRDRLRAAAEEIISGVLDGAAPVVIAAPRDAGALADMLAAVATERDVDDARVERGILRLRQESSSTRSTDPPAIPEREDRSLVERA